MKQRLEILSDLVVPCLIGCLFGAAAWMVANGPDIRHAPKPVVGSVYTVHIDEPGVYRIRSVDGLVSVERIDP